MKKVPKYKIYIFSFCIALVIIIYSQKDIKINKDKVSKEYPVKIEKTDKLIENTQRKIIKKSEIGKMYRI